MQSKNTENLPVHPQCLPLTRGVGEVRLPSKWYPARQRAKRATGPRYDMSGRSSRSEGANHSICIQHELTAHKRVVSSGNLGGEGAREREIMIEGTHNASRSRPKRQEQGLHIGDDLANAYASVTIRERTWSDGPSDLKTHLDENAHKPILEFDSSITRLGGVSRCKSDRNESEKGTDT